MTCAFLGGSVGSWLGVRAYERCLGWNGVCLLVAAQAALALAGHILLTRHLPTGHLLGGRRLRASRPASGGGS